MPDENPVPARGASGPTDEPAGADAGGAGEPTITEGSPGSGPTAVAPPTADGRADGQTGDPPRAAAAQPAHLDTESGDPVVGQAPAASPSATDGNPGHPPAPTDSGASPTSAAEGAEDGTEPETPPKQARQRKGSFLRELPVLLLVALALAVLIKTFLVQAFFIPSGSMEQTLHGCAGCSGDRVLVNKLIHRFRDPRPGEIVVFRGPESWAPEAQFSEPTNPVQRVFRGIGSAIGFAPPGEKDFVKRVIAVGGQTVECCDADGRVTVDDRPLDEPYVYLSDPNSGPTRFGPVTVPEGRLWVMGDHRDASLDSRGHIGDADQGTISADDVIGKAFVIVWPPSRWGTLGTPETFAQASAASAAAGTPYLVAAGVVGPIVAVRRRRRRGRGR